MPVSATAAAAAGGFELVADVRANDQIPVQKYRSPRTGLRVVVAQVQGPNVNGFFCVATEAHDDDGLPHTLEHLIFLGSEDYPYKGILDILANRCLSSGTNAWTDTDHTCYTMETAGTEGFLNLMPIYMDHILYPTLTDSGFVTEVHHVDGSGEDGGIVYSEMQGRENTGSSRVHLELLRSIYPGDTGYKSETGGIMKNLRESTDNVKIRNYHKQFYRPDNIFLIITGQVEPSDILNALEPIEAKIISKGALGPYTRPWQSPVPPFVSALSKDVFYPSDDEVTGMVYVAWRGPNAVHDMKGVYAQIVLMDYLTETSVSPLQAEFVEAEDPLASSVGYSVIENVDSVVYTSFETVPKEKIPLVEARLKSVLSDVAVTGKRPLDMERMKTIINRKILAQKSAMENEPESAIAFMIIGDQLYGNSKDDLKIRLNPIEEYTKFLLNTEEVWLDMLRKILAKPWVVIRGIPSIELEKNMTKVEHDRIEEQKKRLGEEGLKKKTQILEDAIEENERPAPDDVIEAVKVPSVDSIRVHNITSWTSLSEPNMSLDLKETDMFVQFNHISSNFAYIYVILETGYLPKELLSYLPLLLELMFESPIADDDGKVVPYEEVVASLTEHTLQSKGCLGLLGSRFRPGSYAQYAGLYMQMERHKYHEGLKLLRKLMYNSKFTEERVKVMSTKMETSVFEMKRSGSRVLNALMRDVMYTDDSVQHITSMCRQQKFLSDVSKLASSGKAEKVLEDLEALRSALVQPKNIMVIVAGDFEKLERPVQPWLQFAPEDVHKTVNRLELKSDSSWIAAGAGSRPRHVITGVGAVETSYLYRSCPAVNDPNDPMLPALTVYIQYLVQLEGPMWRKIRGQGLSYGYHIQTQVSNGHLSLSLTKSVNVVGAYSEATKILESYLNGEEDFDETELEAAKSSLIFEIIEEEKTVGDLVLNAVKNVFKGVDHGFNRRFIESVSRVTVTEMKAAGERYLRTLLDSARCRTAIVCHPSKVDEVQQKMKEMGTTAETFHSVDESLLNDS